MCAAPTTVEARYNTSYPLIQKAIIPGKNIHQRSFTFIMSAEGYSEENQNLYYTYRRVQLYQATCYCRIYLTSQPILDIGPSAGACRRSSCAP